jgi:hypothetical protein
LVQKKGGEMRYFNEGEGMEGEGSGKGKFLIIYMFQVWFRRGEERERILIVNVFGLRGEGVNDKTKLFFYPYNLIRVL